MEFSLVSLGSLIARRVCSPRQVLLPGKSHGWRSLVGCSPWGHWGSDTTEWLHFHISLSCIGEENGNPLQCSCPESPRDGGAWWAAVSGVAQSRTQLNNFTFTFNFHALEKETATHSSVLAWRIPGMGEPGGLLSVGSHRVGHDWSNLAAACSPNGTLPKFPKQCSFQEATDSDISSQCRVSGKFTVLFCLQGTY